MLDQLKRFLPYRLRQSLKRRVFHVKDMHSRLDNLRRAGFHCKGAIDAGAYTGSWTDDFWYAYPGVPSIMVEPLPHLHERLSAKASTVPGSRAIQAALGRGEGRSAFRIGETNSYLIQDTSTLPGSAWVEVDVLTLDSLLGSLGTNQPNLLKLDLQGAELDCLQGCSALARHFEVVITEVSIIPIGGVPEFSVLHGFMEATGYRLYDILPQYYRPLDDALWQCDAFYVRKDSSLIQSMEWA